MNNKLKRFGNIAFYIALALFTFWMIKRKYIAPSIKASQIQFQTYSNPNENITFDNYPNKVIVVNFWQTWCGPCVHELPSLNEMNQKWEDIQVLCISDEPLNKVQSYITNYPNIHFLTSNQFETYQVSQFPTTYIFNKKGVKVHSKIGSKNWSDDNFIATLKKNWK